MKENPFKNSSGVYLIRELFYEGTGVDKSSVLYTLKEEDHQGYPSLRRLYLLEDDPTEYMVAEKYFGGWPHWKKLSSSTWFIPYLTPIREELEVRHRAQYLKSLRTDALQGDKVSSKYLLDRFERDVQSKGRPSKLKIKEEADRLFKESSDIKDDFARLTEGLKT